MFGFLVFLVFLFVTLVFPVSLGITLPVIAVIIIYKLLRGGVKGLVASIKWCMGK